MDAAWCMDPEFGIALFSLGGIILSVFAYFVPSIAAGLRSHPRLWPVFLVNLLLGWTFVGWFVAMAWAMKRYPETTTAKSYFDSIADANRVANARALAKPGLNRPSRETVIAILGVLILIVGTPIVVLVVARILLMLATFGW